METPDIPTLVEELRAVKTCEEEPGACADGSGPYCQEHGEAALFVPAMRKAADLLESQARTIAEQAATIARLDRERDEALANASCLAGDLASILRHERKLSREDGQR